MINFHTEVGGHLAILIAKLLPFSGITPIIKRKYENHYYNLGNCFGFQHCYG